MNAADIEHHRPIVGNWTNAEWFNGLIKIPLLNANGFAWVANLQLGTPLQIQGVCVFDNNNHETATFDRYCRGCNSYFFDQSRSSTYKGDEGITYSFLENGEELIGFKAVDDMCVGSM